MDQARESVPSDSDKPSRWTSAVRRTGRGRPSMEVLSGLFLPSAAWEMRSIGFPWTRLEDEPFSFGTLFRNVRRKDVSPATCMRQVEEIYSKSGGSAEGDRIMAWFKDALADGADKSDEIANKWLAQAPGDWACFSANLKPSDPWPGHFISTYVEIENASSAANRVLANGRFSELGGLVCSNPSLSPYWHSSVLNDLACSKQLADSLKPRLKAWIQLELDLIARFALESPSAVRSIPICGEFDSLLTGRWTDPGAAWLGHAIALTGTRSVVDLHKLLISNQPRGASPSKATLDRWSSAKQFPQQGPQLQAFVDRVSACAHLYRSSLSPGEVAEALRTHYFVAQRLNRTIWVASRLYIEPRNALAEWLRRWRLHRSAGRSAKDTPALTNG